MAPSIKLPKFKRNTDNLSQGMDKIQFEVDELQSYGEAGRVKALAYDPVQSLMAVATEFNHVCIFGQARVTYTLELQTVNPIKALRFVKGIYLLVFDSVDTIFVISLFTKTVLRKITTSVEITAFDTDYSLEFVFVGLKNGMVKAFDIETGKQTFLNIVEERRSSFPLVADKHVCSLKLHPRDIGTLLISYPKETMIYSLADDKVMLSFIYTLERTAPGGENATYAYGADGMYLPDVTHSLWHPNGLHIVTVHDDNSIVFWDAKTGERILARTLFDSYVDAPTGKECKRDRERMSSISTIRWLCDSDPEKSMLLIMGGDSYADEGCHQLVRMNFGKMISYSMSTYQHMADYYSQPKQQNIFAIHSNANVSDFVPLPEKSPYFDGNQKPALVALIMSDGSLKFMNYPEGSLSFDARRFPSTVSWLNPKITCSSSSYLDTRILSSIYEAFPPNVSILKGGIPSKPKYRVVAGSVVITGHESGFIRVWNSSEGALDSSSVLEIDIGGILQNDECSVSSISFAPEQTELSCGLVNGDVLLFSYQSNKLYQPRAIAGLTNKMSSLSIRGNAVVDISDRAPLDLKKGFMPKLLVRALDNGRVTALCNSSVNFVAVGYESGRLLVIDRRGGVVIHNEILQDAGLSIKITPTAIQFGFGITGTQQQRCSILMYVGTSIGRLITYQLLADARGRFTVNRIEDIDSNDSDIVDILAVNSVTGRPCSPTLGQLRSQPLETDLAFPLVISASTSDIRVIKNDAKIAHKTYGKGDISKVGVTGARTVDGNISFCLVCINGRSKKIAALSLPSLSQLSELRIPYRVEAKYAQQSSVLPLGDIFLRITETEAALVNIMNLRQAIRGPETSNSADVLFLKNIMVPWRPTFNQMVKNTAGITYSQLYKLLLGRDRPEKGSTEEYTKAWNISPYNPANYSLLGAGKPKYYDPNALHQHIDVGKSPKSAHSFENNGWQVSKLKKYASDAIEHSANKVEAYVSDVNDNFDQAVKDARKEALRSIVKSGF
ncbi:DEKNAAC102775 [Brettanomyces naardenensis]|uniref:DEKNAAC102775 n=1 Tax=Brettanomyces naardenensis TaxID=13370 RepID=A0A448YKN2_BRENA|nr:DEKNAAC102775 [Brettanomyces naardenensis]